MLARFCFARMGFVDAKRRREEGIGKGNIVPLVSAVGGVGDHSETVPHVLGTFATKVPPRRDNREAESQNDLSFPFDFRWKSFIRRFVKLK